MKPAKRICCAILGKPELHTGEDLYICGLPECKTTFTAEYPSPYLRTPYLPLCGSHRALAETKSVLVYVNEGLGEFRL